VKETDTTAPACHTILLIRSSDARLGTMSPPLGLLYLASAVRQWCERPWTVRFVDLGLHGRSWRPALAQLLDQHSPAVVGVSALTCESGLAHQVFRFLRERSDGGAPRPLTLLGGPYATSSPGLALRNGADDLDGILIGEGELALPRLLDQLTAAGTGEGSSRPVGPRTVEVWRESLPRLLVREDGWHHVRTAAVDDDSGNVSQRAPRVEDLDTLPPPAWDLLPSLDRYADLPNWNGMLKGRPYMSVMTSRGCPYGCSYCHSFFGRRIRLRSAGNVVREIEELQRTHGVREIHIIDDIFNVDLDRAKAICDGISALGSRVHIAFPNGIRGDLLDRELLEKLARAGTYKINFGVETASPRLQKEIGKRLDLGKLEEAVRLTRRLGMIPFGFFMLGFPGETREEMKQTIEFAVRSDLLTAKFFQVIPYPGTELGRQWQREQQEEFLTPGMDEYHFFSNRVTCSEMDPREVNDLVAEAYLRFFSRPGRVIGLLSRHPRPVAAVQGLWRLHTSLLRYRVQRWMGKEGDSIVEGPV